MKQYVAQRTTVTTTNNQHAMRVGVSKHRDMDQRLVIGEFLGEAGLQRAAEDQGPTRSFEVQHLERLPGCLLRVQTRLHAIALLNACV